MRPIGLFGGTFDPVHFGHLRTAVELLELLRLEEVRLIPSGCPPHRAAPAASTHHRLAMLRLAVQGQPGLTVDRRELDRGGASYTVDTLRSLRQEVGEARPLCLLLGLDAFLALHTWSRWADLPELAHIVVVHRPGWHVAELAGDSVAGQWLRERGSPGVEALHHRPAGLVQLEAVTPLGISATAIRALAREGRNLSYLLPDAVACYIHDNDLYRK